MTYYVDILIQKTVETPEEYHAFRQDVLKGNNLDYYISAGFQKNHYLYPSIAEESELFHKKGSNAKD